MEIIKRAKGPFLYTPTKKKYFDLSAGYLGAIFGYHPPFLTQLIKDSLQKFTFDGLIEARNPSYKHLIEKILNKDIAQDFSCIAMDRRNINDFVQPSTEPGMEAFVFTDPHRLKKATNPSTSTIHLQLGAIAPYPFQSIVLTKEPRSNFHCEITYRVLQHTLGRLERVEIKRKQKEIEAWMVKEIDSKLGDESILHQGDAVREIQLTTPTNFSGRVYLKNTCFWVSRSRAHIHLPLVNQLQHLPSKLQEFVEWYENKKGKFEGSPKKD